MPFETLMLKRIHHFFSDSGLLPRRPPEQVAPPPPTLPCQPSDFVLQGFDPRHVHVVEVSHLTQPWDELICLVR